MQNPVVQIPTILTTLTTSPSPAVLQQTFQTYFLPTTGFRHPLCKIDPGPGSRERVAGLYRWYQMVSEGVGFKTLSIVYNEELDVMYIEVEQYSRIRFSPFKPAPAHLTVRLTLQEEAGLHYIAMQEDLYHPEDLSSLLLPPLTPFVTLLLNGAGVVSNVNAWAAGLIRVWILGSAGAGVSAVEGVNAISAIEDVGEDVHSTVEGTSDVDAVNKNNGTAGDDIRVEDISVEAAIGTETTGIPTSLDEKLKGDDKDREKDTDRGKTKDLGKDEDRKETRNHRKEKSRNKLKTGETNRDKDRRKDRDQGSSRGEDKDHSRGEEVNVQHRRRPVG